MEEDPGERSIGRAVDSLGDRLGVSPWSIVGAVAAVVGAVVGGWWAFSTPDPPPPEEVLPRASEVAALVSTTTTVAAAEVLVVHVDGAVLVPGVHEVGVDARVIDAVDAAGGLRADADRTRVNLAQPLADGQRVWVPAVGEDEPAVVAPIGGEVDGGDASPTDSGAPIDLNRANPSELEELPGVGPTIAAAIVGHREREGAFRTVDDLLEVPGIGPSRLAQLAPLVRV